MDELQAAFLRVKLERLEAWNEDRRRCAAAYRRALSDLPLALPEEMEGRRHAYHLYAIRVKARDDVRRALEAGGIETGIHYPVPLHCVPAFEDLGYATGRFPEAEAVAEEELSLPIYPGLSDDAIMAVRGILAGVEVAR